jgi:mannitol-1-phosphate 5-dehydrogenase
VNALVVGAGRMAGGFVAPLLGDAGWTVTLAGRTPAVVAALEAARAVRVRTGAVERIVAGVGGVDLRDGRLDSLALDADLLVTSVGAAALPAVARRLAPALRLRTRPVNILLVENHRRAAELFVEALLRACPALAPAVGRTIGIAGVAAWRAVASRELDSGLATYAGDDVDECYVDAAALVHGVAPLDGSVPGMTLVHGFDRYMLEKLWLFNGGHAAAAYLGYLRGHRTLAEAMADNGVRASVAAVLREVRTALAAQRLPGHVHDDAAVLARYADPTLQDRVTRVARGPRRKLAHGDRLIGPAVACLAAGVVPHALAAAAAAALQYDAPADTEAQDLRREVGLLGPAETIAAVARLDRRDELVRLVAAAYHDDEEVLAA